MRRCSSCCCCGVSISFAVCGLKLIRSTALLLSCSYSSSCSCSCCCFCSRCCFYCAPLNALPVARAVSCRLHNSQSIIKSFLATPLPSPWTSTPNCKIINQLLDIKLRAEINKMRKMMMMAKHHKQNSSSNFSFLFLSAVEAKQGKV